MCPEAQLDMWLDMGSLSLSTHKLGAMLPFHRWGDRGPERQGDFVRVTRPALRPSSQCLCFVASVGSTQLFPRQPHHTPHSHLPKPLHMPLLDIWCHLLPACQTHCVHSFCTSRASRAQASLTFRKQSQSPGESAPHGLLPPPLLLHGLLFHIHSLWAAPSSMGGNGNGVYLTADRRRKFWAHASCCRHPGSLTPDPSSLGHRMSTPQACASHPTSILMTTPASLCPACQASMLF